MPPFLLYYIVDGVSGTDNIANLFASKFGALINKHSSTSNSILDSIQCSLTDSHLRSILKKNLSSPSPLVRSVFHDTCHLAYFFNGYNSQYGHTHLKFYNDSYTL